jgi:hypothetical protein
MIDVRDAAVRTDGQTAPDVERLKTYSRLKLSLASQLRTLRDVLTQRGHERRERQCEELQV